MSEKSKELVLDFLRRIDERTERTADDVRDLKHRMTLLEERVAHLDQSVGLVGRSYAGLQQRIDGMDGRLDRIETAVTRSDVRR